MLYYPVLKNWLCLFLEPLLYQSLVPCLWDIFFWLFIKECNWSHTLKHLVLAPSSGRKLYSNGGSLTTPSLNFNPLWNRSGGGSSLFQQPPGKTGTPRTSLRLITRLTWNKATIHTHHPIYDQYKCMSLECGRKPDYLGRTRHKGKRQEHANSTQKGLSLPERFKPLTFLL